MEDFQGVKNLKQDSKGISLTLCRTCKTCPDVIISNDSPDVVLGGDHEGITTWTKQQFKDFCELTKTGIFDSYLDNEDSIK